MRQRFTVAATPPPRMGGGSSQLPHMRCMESDRLSSTLLEEICPCNVATAELDH